MHAVAIARELGMRRVLVPRFPGLLSAIGLLLADPRFDSVRTFPCIVERDGVHGIAAGLRDLVDQGIARVRGEGFIGDPVVTCTLDMRYERQAWEIGVPVDHESLEENQVNHITAAYDAEHERLFGFSMPHEYHEVINLRVTVTGALGEAGGLLDRLVPDFPASAATSRHCRQIYDDIARGFSETPAYERDELALGQTILGPAIVEETDSTTWIPSNTRGHVDQHGNLLLDLE